MSSPEAERPKKFGYVEGLTLAHYVLVRELHLRELVVIEEKQCAICDFNREILYYGNYEGMGGCFNVCELCGRELIEGSAAIIKSLEWSTSVLSSVDNLEVWCAVCQKTMRLITGPNYVKGWYACEPQDSPCASHAVVISISETKAMQAAEGGAKS